MPKSICVIDYGAGNIKSIISALKYSGFNRINIAERVEEVGDPDVLILPGVGAFGPAVRKIKERGFWSYLREHEFTETKLLGICLGMQLLCTYSTEFGLHDGLGLIDGIVSSKNMISSGKKIPSIGWHETIFNSGHTNYDGYYYYVHSFSYDEIKSDNIISHYVLGEQKIISGIKDGNIYGFQFHPEKSGYHGLNIMKDIILDKA